MISLPDVKSGDAAVRLLYGSLDLAGEQLRSESV